MKKKVVSKKLKQSAPGKEVALKGTVGRLPKSATAKHLAWKEVELEELTPMFHRQLIVGKGIMLARILLKKGCVVPWHSHANEQVSSIFEGVLKFWIDGKEIVVRPSEVLTIPPNMPHKAEALEDTVAIDVFNPPRADWINKTDGYLRK
jgi:quercetin dioxygenase-like cupin family protein